MHYILLMILEVPCNKKGPDKSVTRIPAPLFASTSANNPLKGRAC